MLDHLIRNADHCRLVYITGNAEGAKRFAAKLEQEHDGIQSRNMQAHTSPAGHGLVKVFVRTARAEGIVPVVIDPDRVFDARFIEHFALYRVVMLDERRADVTCCGDTVGASALQRFVID